MNTTEDKLVIPLSPISAPMTSRVDEKAERGAPSSPSRRSFRDTFLYNFESVRARLRKSENTITYLVSLARLRVSQEKLAADAAEKLISRSDISHILLPGESNAGLSVDALRLNIIKRARQSRQFIEETEDEVIKPLIQASKDHEKLFASLERDGLLLASALKDEYESHDVALLQYDKAYRLAASGVQLLHPATLPEDHIRIGLNCESSLETERRYHEAVLRVNQVRREYNDSMSLILTQLEDLERARLTMIKETIDKVFIFELSLNRSAQYELESSFKEIETASKNDELAQYLSSIPANHDDGPVMAVSARDFSDFPPPSAPEVASSETQSTVSQVISAIWENPKEISKDELESLTEALETEDGRLSFCREIAQKNADLKSMIAFSNLGTILNVALTAAESAMDSETGRRIAAFALRFYISDPQEGRKKYLQADIYHHSLWNRIHFWEEALTLTVADNFINEYVDSCGEPAPQPLTLESGLTIDRFGTYLMVFGISVQSAVEIVKRVMNRTFSHVDDKDTIEERLLRSIKVAHDRQERNVALLQQSRPSSPTSP